MRLYRGKRKDNKEWVHGWYFKSFTSSLSFIIADSTNHPMRFTKTKDAFIEVIPETVGQQVGPKDKNGKEIYDGDEVIEIFECAGHKTETYTGIVTWWDSGWFLKTKKHGMISLTDGSSSLEIIGNIHDKLLEQE